MIKNSFTSKYTLTALIILSLAIFYFIGISYTELWGEENRASCPNAEYRDCGKIIWVNIKYFPSDGGMLSVSKASLK